MATPSSSTTTPSPQLRYVQPATPQVTPLAPNVVNLTEREERERAVQKFLARAEIGKLTRGLRTRLSYATYKATHNLAHNTLRDLETQTPSQGAQVRTTPTKVPGNHHNQPATSGGSAMTPSSSSRMLARKGSMAPPPPVTASATQSLFSSLLAPPPAKRARTIHNPQDPPIPAPQRVKDVTPPARRTVKSARTADTSHTKTKTRKGAKDRSGATASSKGKGKARITQRGSFGTGGGGDGGEVDIDMKAAATLTSLLLSSRPSISASASSPRSSISAGSDTGSAHSYSQFAQSSARTVTAATSAMPSVESSFTAPAVRAATPPAPSSANVSRQSSFATVGATRAERTATPKLQQRERVVSTGTPHPPSDTEAADLMLFLATSPSPVRPTAARDRDAKDSVALRALGGGSALKGRVLFPSQGGGGDAGAVPSPNGRKLQRETSGHPFFESAYRIPAEFTGSPGRGSSISSSEVPFLHPKVKTDSLEGGAGHHLDVPMAPTITPPTPTDPVPSQLLPPPPSPKYAERPKAPPADRLLPPPPLPADRGKPPGPHAPPTPGTSGFNLSDFVNVTPSPAMAAGAQSRLAPSLPTEIGRRLFDEHHGTVGSAGPAQASPTQKNGLGAGIDLVQS